MTVKVSTATANALANALGLKSQLDGGRLFIFAGPVPATADEALDMVTDHTEIVEITESGDGLTGITFDAPSAGLLSKAAAESWQETAAFDGAEDAEPTLLATFFRFCASGDDGRAAANATTGYRLQGTIGDLASSAPMKMTNPTRTNSALVNIDSFGVRIGAVS
ncbi:hypothetical protein [uncultured Arenimonas sp.]|uniref:hypothetical protein n=1 Tax=uncultured Arenimonas sp. TaxID=546226 RepID=UPI0030D98984